MALFSLEQEVADGRISSASATQWNAFSSAEFNISHRSGKEEKFLLMQIPKHWGDDCGGLANQMWRFAVLFSMAKELGRRPGMLGSSKMLCERKNRRDEIKNTFPVMHKYLEPNFRPRKSESVYYDNFLYNCCEFVDPIKLMGSYAEKHVIIAPPPQSYKFFENHFDEIRELFKFSDQLRQEINQKISQYFSDDPLSHKLCVHTRRGDFGRPEWPWHQPSTVEFTQKATDFAMDDLRRTFPHLGPFFSIILLGEDKRFLRKLNFGSEPHRVYIPERMDRDRDLCFAVHACHSLLITASSSTYAWWIGFLLKGNRQHRPRVYFNADFSQSLYSRSNFLPNWIPIKLTNSGGQMVKLRN